MKQIVFGANGFLGSALVNRLVHNTDVLAVYNNSTNRINSKAKLIHISNIHKIKNEKISTIFYSVGNYSSSFKDLFYNNVELLNSVINFFKDSKIVFISSTSVYGNNFDIISENSAFNNPSIYGLSKIAGEFITQNAIRYSIVRLCYIYGANLNNNSFIPNIINQAKSNEIILFGEGKREQDYLHIDDAVNILIKSSVYDQNDIFLAATGKSYSNHYIANILKQQKNDIKIHFSGIESGSSFHFNPEATFNKLQFKPEVPIEDGIKKMWYESINNG